MLEKTAFLLITIISFEVGLKMAFSFCVGYLFGVLSQPLVIRAGKYVFK